MNTIGKNIRKYRQARGLTQKMLAKKIGVAHNTISGWEAGKYEPDAEKIQSLLWILQIDANTLLGWNSKNKLKKDAEELASKFVSNQKVKRMIESIEKMSEEDTEVLSELIKRIMKE